MTAAPPVVLVTGSSRGLGRGVAEVLAQAGFSVAIHYASNREAAQATVTACEKLATHPGQKFVPVGGNIGVAADRQRLFDEVLSAYGHLDALVNNAGIAPRIRADITEATEEIFDEVIGINLKGPYFLSQLAARYWLAHPDGCQLNGGYKLLFVTSLSANTASINRGEYCISKAGLAMATQLWAVRLADAGVQVLELRPGIMATDMTSGAKALGHAPRRRARGQIDPRGKFPFLHRRCHQPRRRLSPAPPLTFHDPDSARPHARQPAPRHRTVVRPLRRKNQAPAKAVGPGARHARFHDQG
jgi:3-oxoacyl-[acyl-carrier protein] reductase